VPAGGVRRDQGAAAPAAHEWQPRSAGASAPIEWRCLVSLSRQEYMLLKKTPALEAQLFIDAPD